MAWPLEVERPFMSKNKKPPKLRGFECPVTHDSYLAMSLISLRRMFRALRAKE